MVCGQMTDGCLTNRTIDFKCDWQLFDQLELTSNYQYLFDWLDFKWLISLLTSIYLQLFEWLDTWLHCRWLFHQPHNWLQLMESFLRDQAIDFKWWMSPKVVECSESWSNVSKSWSNFPESSLISPKVGQISPKFVRISPKVGQISPKVGQISPNVPKVGQIAVDHLSSNQPEYKTSLKTLVKDKRVSLLCPNVIDE